MKVGVFPNSRTAWTGRERDVLVDEMALVSDDVEPAVGQLRAGSEEAMEMRMDGVAKGMVQVVCAKRRGYFWLGAVRLPIKSGTPAPRGCLPPGLETLGCGHPYDPIIHEDCGRGRWTRVSDALGLRWASL